MGDTMPGEHCKIVRFQKVFVADFHPITPALGDAAQESVQVGHEITAKLIIGRAPAEGEKKEAPAKAEKPAKKE